MKSLKNKLQLLVLFLLTFLTSCVYEPIDGTVEGDPDTGGTVSSGVFKADFNGKTWTAKETQVVISGNYIEISAIKANGEGFGFMVEASQTGSYPANINILAFTPAGSEDAYWSFNDDNPDENTGSIVITKIDSDKKTISGTFTFKGYWGDPDNPRAPIQFTKGVFTDLPYITEAETEDVFAAKVDGVSFVTTDIIASTIGTGTDEWITIGVQDANMNTISINVKSNVIATTYSITTNTLTDKVQASFEDENDEYQAISGSVTIISITDDRIKGTFSFATNGASPFQITEGSFDVGY